jgi:hypothetical protein
MIFSTNFLWEFLWFFFDFYLFWKFLYFLSNVFIIHRIFVNIFTDYKLDSIYCFFDVTVFFFFWRDLEICLWFLFKKSNYPVKIHPPKFLSNSTENSIENSNYINSNRVFWRPKMNKFFGKHKKPLK